MWHRCNKSSKSLYFVFVGFCFLRASFFEEQFALFLMMNTKPSKDISHEISKCVEEVTYEIVNSHKTEKGDESMSSTAELFLKV